MANTTEKHPIRRLQTWLYVIIFGADSPLGQAFDVVLLVSIIASVGTVMLDSVAYYHEHYGAILYTAEWFFTILFTIEYALRIFCVPNRLRYATSFFGIVDVLAIIPTYLSLLIPGTQYLLVIRLLRVLRVFRVLKMMAYLGESNVLLDALKESRRKIFVFLFTVITLVTILGSLMYLIEGPENGFTSIPLSVYWAIVTLTTVGYGDISPHTPTGQALSALVMILGYSILAVPTGIVSVELSHAMDRTRQKKHCPHCKATGHPEGAKYCYGCGETLG
jgi:voltage-gated potassium channel